MGDLIDLHHGYKNCSTTLSQYTVTRISSSWHYWWLFALPLTHYWNSWC